MKEKTFKSEKEMREFLKGMDSCRYSIKTERKNGERVYNVSYVKAK